MPPICDFNDPIKD